MKLFAIMGFTFVVGVMTGSYIYFSEYKPQFVVEEDPVLLGDDSTVLTAPNEDTAFVIVASEYGGCVLGNGCASYRIVGDGSFVYSGATKNDGELTAVLLADLETSLDPAALSEMSILVESSVCSSFVDGVDVNYQIELSDVTYELDTCTTAFNPQSTLGKQLTSFWEVLAQ